MEAPGPQELTRDAVGYFCNMTVVEHKGPKGQIFLTDREQPLWFTSVRDTMAFTMLPGEPKNIAAIYVTDMGRASWDTPEPGIWIDAHTAFYVLGSDRIGGMRAQEVVPFAKRADADLFVQRHGGVCRRFRRDTTGKRTGTRRVVLPFVYHALPPGSTRRLSEAADIRVTMRA